MQTIALLLCTVFVLFLLWLDHMQDPDASICLWIPTIWMLYVASKPLAVWFGSAGDADGSPLDRNFLIVLFAIGVAVLAWRRVRWAETVNRNSWLLLIICYMLLSVAWSDIAYVSLKRWFRELVAVSMALLVATERSPNRAMLSVLRRTIYVLIPFSVLLIKYYPEYGVIYVHHEGIQMWTGVTMHKNGLGRLCMISLFFLVWDFWRRHRNREPVAKSCRGIGEITIVVMILWLLNIWGDSYSATAIGAFAIGIMTLGYLSRIEKRRIRIKPHLITMIVLFAVGFGTLTVMGGGSTMAGIASAFGRNTTLTGRTDIWSTLFPIAMQSPVLGHGFGGFWTPLNSARFFEISECHNGYLEIIMELGFVGVISMSGFLISCGRKATRGLNDNYSWASLQICFLLMIVFYNITESSLNTFTSHITAVVLFLFVSTCEPLAINRSRNE